MLVKVVLVVESPTVIMNSKERTKISLLFSIITFTEYIMLLNSRGSAITLEPCDILTTNLNIEGILERLRITSSVYCVKQTINSKHYVVDTSIAPSESKGITGDLDRYVRAVALKYIRESKIDLIIG